MSSLFDSEVYAERQRLPGVSINLSRLMERAKNALRFQRNSEGI